jgi:hypothetical protein
MNNRECIYTICYTHRGFGEDVEFYSDVPCTPDRYASSLLYEVRCNKKLTRRLYDIVFALACREFWSEEQFRRQYIQLEVNFQNSKIVAA